MHSFLLQLNKMPHISQKEFKTVNWLPIKERYNKCLNSIAFQCFDSQCPHYLNDSSNKKPESNLSLRNRFQKLKHSFRKTHTGQNALSFIGPALWNKVPAQNLNTFKHNLKKYYLK